MLSRLVIHSNAQQAIGSQLPFHFRIFTDANGSNGTGLIEVRTIVHCFNSNKISVFIQVRLV